MTGFHEPTGWSDQHPWMQEGPGIHQIRLYSGLSSQGLIVKCCCSTKTLAIIKPGADCWGPFNRHLESMNDSHSAT